MQITVNGQIQNIGESLTLKAFIDSMNSRRLRIIAEVNGAIIKAPLWPSTVLKGGDTVELVTVVGGG